MTPESALAHALQALGWLAARPGGLEALLGASGLVAGDLRARASDPEFLGFVLDHLLSDEAMARDFAEETGAAPETTLRARAALPGGDEPHWT